jgi:hypothetical protein
MWAHEHEGQTCEPNFVNKKKSFIECSCHMDIILLLIHEIPIATLEKYCCHMENIPMML